MQDFCFWKAVMRPWSVTLLNGSLILVPSVAIATPKSMAAAGPPVWSWLSAVVSAWSTSVAFVTSSVPTFLPFEMSGYAPWRVCSSALTVASSVVVRAVAWVWYALGLVWSRLETAVA